MKSTQEKVFVVVDPTASEHIALQRAIITAKFRKPLPKLYIFVGVDAESVDTRATNDTLYKKILRGLKVPFTGPCAQRAWSIKLRFHGRVSGRSRFCNHRRDLAQIFYCCLSAKRRAACCALLSVIRSGIF